MNVATLTCSAVVFDLLGTLFPLAPLRTRLQRAGLPPQCLPLWMARSLRDAQALETTGSFTPFDHVAAASLRVLAGEHGIVFDMERAHWVTEGFAALDIDHYAGAACHHLDRAGVPYGFATNLGPRLVRRMLERAGLWSAHHPIASAEDVGRFKPAAEVYRLAARIMDARPQETALISAHSWDIQGGYHAGLLTVWIRDDDLAFHPAMHPPHLRAVDLNAAVVSLLGAAPPSRRAA